MNGKQLKNSILQWAIQGKLVPQNPKDEPASKLLERIAAARNGDGAAPACHPERSAKACDESCLDQSVILSGAKNLAKKTKKKKPAPASRIYREGSSWFEQVGSAEPKDITEEIPFDIPESWEWVRLPMVGELNRGKSQARPRNDPSLFSNGTFPMIQTGDVARAETVISSCKSMYNEKGVAQSRIWPKGTVCLTIAANIGDVAILGFDACFPDSVVGFNAYTPIDSNLFFLYALKCYKNILDELSRSTAQKNINIDILSKIFFPLPPLAEQKRIVKKLEQILPLVDEYDQAQTQLDKLNKELPESLKKSILQQAIQGKLVPQNPKDEPADKLLERINISRHSEHSEESSKKSRKSSSKNPVSRIYRDTDGLWYEQTGSSEPVNITEEIPFEIPETWTWCRLQSIVSKLVDGDHNPPAGMSNKTKYLMLSSRNINDDKLVDLDKVRYLTEDLFTKENERTNAQKGDILFTSVGTIGRSCILSDELHVCFQRSVTIMTTDIYNEYLKRVFDSPFYQSYAKEHAIGTAQLGFYLKEMAQSLIPLPPLAEQKRIVAKLEQMFNAL